MNEWIELFKSIGEKVHQKTKKIIGSEKAKEVIGEGQFGDNTVYIDKLAEDIVISSILGSGMSCSILTEEKGWVEVNGKYPTVIVDPIDGSLNAKRGIPYYALSIGLAYESSIDSIGCGYVLNLANGDEFWAIRGKGAFFNGNIIKQNLPQKIGVVAVEGLKKQTKDNLTLKIFKSFYRVRQSGSTALDMCYTAIGAYDVFLHLDKARIVDYAAGKIIVEEAGGCLFDWLSTKRFCCSISMEKTRPFVVAMSKESMLEVIKRLS